MPKKSQHSDTKFAEDLKHEKKEYSLEEALIKNLIELQKIQTDMAEKFDKLSKEISHLLALFELTARSFAKNAPVGEFEKDKEFLDKIDTLLDQNKTLAKGLVLMEERLRERMYGPSNAPVQPAPQAKPLAHSQTQQKSPNTEEEFQSSMNPNRPLPRF